MTIRPMDGDEVDMLADLLRRSFATTAERFGLTVESCPKSPAFYTSQRVAADLDRGATYSFLEEDGHVCGCVAVEHAKPGVVYLERLAVLPEHRSKGYGRALVRYALAEAKAGGAERVEIGIFAEDTQIKDWYRQFGFEQTGTKKFEHLPFVVAFMAVELSVERRGFVNVAVDLDGK
jgi:ribosomal protein S18 acetylase RimI-like enzyme